MKPHTAGAYIGLFFVLVISVFGAIDELAKVPSSVVSQTAQVTGGACDKNSFSTGKSIGVETEATKFQKETCTPISCFQTAEGGTKCMPKPAAQAMAGGGGGLMDAIGKMLSSMMQGGGGGGGGDTPQTSMPNYVDPQYGVAPACSEFSSDKGSKPVHPGDSVTLSWVRTGGETESITFTPSASGATGISASPITINAPEKSTTYKLTLANRTGSASCSARVYVVPAGESIEEEKVTSSNSRNSDIQDDGDTESSLDDPLGSNKNDSGYNDIVDEDAIAAEKKKAEEDGKTGIIGGVLKTVTGLIASYGQKENFEEDKTAFQEDPSAFENVEEFETAVDTLGKDGIYSKEDIDTLEKLSRELDAQKAARDTKQPAYNSPLTQSELAQLWHRPDASVSGGLGDNFEVPDGGDDSQGIIGAFTSWLKNTFCFWCVSGRTQAGGAILTQNVKLPIIGAKNGNVVNAADTIMDPLTGDCAIDNKKIEDHIALLRSQNDGPSAQAADKMERDYNEKKKERPFEKSNSGLKTDEKKCISKEDANKNPEHKKCFEMCNEKGFAETPAKEINEKTHTVCGQGKSGNKLVCREKKEQTPAEKAAAEKAAAEKAATDGSKGGNENKGNDGGGGGKNDSGGGDKKGDSGGGKMPEMPKLPEKQPEQPKPDPCSLGNAQTNPQCNPTIPTEPPKCGEDGLLATPAILVKGKEAELSWTVTGKGTISTTISYVTRDENGQQEKGSLGVVSGGSATVSPERSTTYTLKATNEVGTVTCKPARVSVRPKTEADDEVAVDEEGIPVSGPSDLVLTCDPTEIQRGSEAEVTWEGCPVKTKSTLGTSTEDVAFTTGGTKEGSVSVKPLRDSTYVVRCRDEFNNTLQRKSCKVNVSDSGVVSTAASTQGSSSSDRPSVSITAPDIAAYGQSVRVEWKSKSTVSCVVYGPGCTEFGRSSPKCFKEVGRAGYVVGNIYTTSVFNVECRGKDRKTLVTDEVTVGVDDGSESEPPANESVSESTQSSVSGSSSQSQSTTSASDPSLEDLLGE